MSTERDITKLIAHAEIRNLLARIARLADLGTPEEYLACFSDNPTWELTQAAGLPIPPALITGKQTILEGVLERRAAGVQGPGTFTAHAVSTTSIEIEGGEARALSLFMYYTGINGTPQLAAVGRYDDTLVRNDSGAWVLHRRVITRE